MQGANLCPHPNIEITVRISRAFFVMYEIMVEVFGDGRREEAQ
jgi:hypothetical protein